MTVQRQQSLATFSNCGELLKPIPPNQPGKASWRSVKVNGMSVAHVKWTIRSEAPAWRKPNGERSQTKWKWVERRSALLKI